MLVAPDDGSIDESPAISRRFHEKEEHRKVTIEDGPARIVLGNGSTRSMGSICVPRGAVAPPKSRHPTS